MTKNFYHKAFNTARNSLIIYFICTVLQIIFGQLPYFIATKTQSIILINNLLMILSLLLFLIIISIEIIKRIKNDFVLNLLRSVSATLHFRKYLRKYIDKNLISENAKLNYAFNKTVNTMTIQFTHDKLLLIIDNPHKKEIEDLLFADGKRLRVALGYYAFDYSLSDLTQDENGYIYMEGTLKNHC